MSKRYELLKSIEAQVHDLADSDCSSSIDVYAKVLRILDNEMAKLKEL